MRTFLITLVCSIAAFIGGGAIMLLYVTNSPEYPLPSPGRAYLEWLSASDMVVVLPQGNLRSEESMPGLARLRFVGSTQALLSVFEKLSAAQVAAVKRSLPFMLDAASARDKAQAEVVAGCIAKANVGDDLNDCAVAVIRMGIKNQ